MSRHSVLALIAFLAASSALGQNFATTNLQLANASALRDPYFGYDALGSMQTLTLEHFRTFTGADLYAFVDVLHGDHATFDGTSSGDRIRYYGEITGRVSLSAVTGKKLSFGRVKDVYAAAEFDRGRGYTGWLAGAGVDLDIARFDVATINLFRKDDNFNGPALQATVVWSRTVTLRDVPVTFVGYLDASTTDADGIDMNAQPQILFDAAPLLRTPKGRLAAGLEVYIHRNARFSAAVPQLVVKWTFQ